MWKVNAYKAMIIDGIYILCVLLDNLDLKILRKKELYHMYISMNEQRLICANNNNLQGEGLESKNEMLFF